jgi:cyclopropane-fatty-acyl-phospholipid synthase
MNPKTSSITPEKSIAISLHLLEELFKEHEAGKVSVRLWDGTLWPDSQNRPATLALKQPGSLRAMFLPGSELGLAEAYLYDQFDIEGEIEAVFELAEYLASNSTSWRYKLLLARQLLRLPKPTTGKIRQRGPANLRGHQHSIERDRQAVTYHYNVSNNFYQLWLDQRMVYSCGYFQTPQDSLDQAQERKLDYICKKLRLQPGQKVLDIGCGWGGLVIHAARFYNVDITGVTLSEPQAELANQRIKEAGLIGQCRVEMRDYRELNSAEAYDALVSVGMFEHVGAALLPTYFDLAYRLLKPGGVFMNHGIACRAIDLPRHGPSFSDAYVFPDGELVPINVTLQAAEQAGFEARDVESLREHYMLTLRNWVKRLEEHHADALEFVDEPTYRVWRLFMSGSAYGFRTGSLNVYQSLLVKAGSGGNSALPLTRSDWYL